LFAVLLRERFIQCRINFDRWVIGDVEELVWRVVRQIPHRDQNGGQEYGRHADEIEDWNARPET
jgi:hypothetical protein